MIDPGFPFLNQALSELRQIKAHAPKSTYRSALVIAAPGLVEALLERQEELESTSTEQACEVIASWISLRILGWCQRHGIPDAAKEELLSLIASVRTGMPMAAPLRGRNEFTRRAK
ncbi:PA2781 family protein [Pseudomonas lopnurensis]|uniref:PA2781 family protein n=1 Tax=Pseudomonas lopnurensis TaxID=1477517 RepID=UPI0028B1C96D|nr:hypothetical protein [Pseudomonas lopnurensis]